MRFFFEHSGHCSFIRFPFRRQVTLGEFVAFIVGWQVILEELISVSSMSSAVSGAINAMSRKAISNYTIEHIGSFHHELLGPFPDFVALGIGLVSVIAMGFGVKTSSTRFWIFGGFQQKKLNIFGIQNIFNFLIYI